MGHVADRWTRPGPVGRVRTDRWGKGMRWQAVWVEPGGQRRKKAFTSKDAAKAHVAKIETDIRGGDYTTGGDTSNPS